MPDQGEKKADKLSFLLQTKVASKKGIEINGLPKEEVKILDDKLNEHLKNEVDKIRDEVIKKLPDKKDAIKKIFDKASNINYKETADKPLNEIILAGLKEEDKKAFKDEELKEFNDILSSSSGRNEVKNILNLDIPLQDNPILNKDFRRAKAVEYANIIGLSDDKLTKLADKDLNLEDINEIVLTDLVKEKILTDSQKNDLLLTAKLSQLTGENFGLVKAVKTANVKSPADFVGWGKGEWLKVIKDNKIPLPEGEESPESYAENLRETIETSFPTEYFLNRTIKNTAAEDFKKLSKNIEPLFNNNVKLFKEGAELVEFSKEDWRGISSDKQKEIIKDIDKLKPLVNTYRYLGIPEILNEDIKLNDKQAKIEKRIKNLEKFYENNTNINLETTDFTTNLKYKKDSGLNFKDIDEATRPLILKQMSAFQRTFVLGENNDVASVILGKGFDSAASIVAKSEEEFIKESGLGIEKGRRVYEKARDLAIGAAHYFEAIRDGVKGIYNNLAVSNQHPLVNDLREIDGFDELFGNQDYCDCEHCRSVLSPAAYFADLMYFVQENVSKKVFTGTNAMHPLYLKRRRPDLWTLKLTCQNTSTEISYLQVVNEVLEKYLKNELVINDIYDVLKNADWSCLQPFNIPLEELRLYISHFGLSLYDIYKTIGLEKKILHREKLRLSEEELNIIKTPNSAGAKKRFGNKALNNFNVQEFIALAGISRAELGDLLKTSFLPEIANVKVKTIKDNTDIQKYREELENLTDSRLDLIHRYLRLWKKTSWKLVEFDLILTALKSRGLLANLEDNDGAGYYKILRLAQLMTIQENLGLTVEELTTVVYQLPQKTILENQKSFAERIFDLGKIADQTIPDKTPYLLPGLGVSEADLMILKDLLSINQPTDIDALSNLYRHARIARGLKMTIEDFKNVIILVLNGQPIGQLDDVEKLIEFSEWINKSPFKVSELAFILKGIETQLNQYKNTFDTITSKILDIQKQEVVKNENDVNKKLNIKKELLKEYLQTTFNITKDQLTNEFLPNLISVDYNNASTAALNATFTNDKPDNPNDFNDLIKLIHELERYTLLFDKLQFKAETITYFIQNKTVFGINDLKALVVDDAKKVSLYKTLIENNADIEVKLQKALKDFQANINFTGNEATLADLWKQPQGLIKSLLANLALKNPAMEAVRYFGDCLQICQKLGIQGDSLSKLTGNNYVVARDVAIAAFASKYEDEKTRKEKLEPYIDKVNTIKRDALCDYIILRYDKFKFKDRGEIYSFFLLDVEMSGCFRTSYLVAAITSLQLYIHRCLVNLEQSDKNLNPNIPDVKVLPTFVPLDEWEWRKNYRVWEANRKVFLYPENYIDPTLRDNKTHIFKELEDELLQQKITKESAEAAYKKYLSQFAELTKLRFAGAYYHRVFDNYGYVNLSPDMKNASSNGAYYMISSIYVPSESDDSGYYLFARTNVHPYQYYYRTYNDNRKTWSNWIKIELGIEANEISSLIHQGKLYIYWTEVKTKEISSVKGGDSTSSGFVFKVYVKYSYLNENGKWSAPQRLFVGQGVEIKDKIYGRVRNGETFNSTRWEKEQDAITERYEEKVFRKPYAFIDKSNISTPIGLSYIWTNNKSNTTVTYVTSTVSYDDGVVKFAIPSQSFTVINNDFSQAKKDITINLTILGIATIQISGTIYLNSCVCQFSSNLISIAIPFQAQVSNQPIKESGFNLSVSRNLITNPNDQNIFNGSSINLYKKEYDVAYLENGDMLNYIESGFRNLTNHQIYQTRNGDGGILISSGGGYEHVPATTILTDELSDIIFAKGLEQFLSLQTQKMSDTYGQQFDFRGPYGEYYWEMFFHIPFLIANHLNANQKFKEAKWWYERVFNPTADENPANTKPTDHNWQFREFRGLTPQKLKDILTDVKAIEAYKKDPFNPHAIARLRISAYQKSVVMKYIDNLLDWGDYLFTQDTRESINEAEMLYQLAFDILGKRPVKLGKCETADENELTYDRIGPKIGSSSEFLITLENYYWVQKRTYDLGVGFVKSSKSLNALLPASKYSAKSLDELGNLASIQKINDLPKKLTITGNITAAGAIDNNSKYFSAVKSYKTIAREKTNRSELYYNRENAKFLKNDKMFDKVSIKPHKRYPAFELVRQTSMVFCVPQNTDLLQYWDRVEDRLFKIRNCMNIRGIRRSLSLFQPPIDPMLLVRARAAGLSLEDIIALIANMDNIPNYRFTYLIEKAKQFAQTVQGFGSALLSALEKKDVEELTLLRTVHEKNILKMTREVKKRQLQEARYQYKAIEEGLTNVQNRIDYYQGLIDTGLIPWEVTEQVTKWTASGIRITEATLGFLTSVFGFLPQVGSPFAMKYGGQELKNGMGRLADATGTLAAIADNIAILAGLEASHQRREQEWKQQLTLAKQEYKQVNQQLLAGDIRQQIAERDLEIYEKNMEQADELHDFYKNKFTGLGLYNYMASNLNRLYREAYNVAFDLSKLAERAYQFERFDNSFYIQNDNWQFDRAGLLAGERLTHQLLQLEKKYIDNNIRTPEIIQSFSLALLDSSQLIQLRQTGSCTIKIPEIAFDILYPGQYRRIIKSIRISIPCVAGPYTNISARLTLLKGEIREKENEAPKEINVAKNTSITTSNANNDSGLFELNFRDERYLPFEGAGAISEWRLELPSKVRSFNYDTISDIILHVDYNALDGDRIAAENALAATIENYALNNGLFRLFSLRYDIPNAFYKLLSQNNQITNFSIDKNHFPYLLSDKNLMITQTKVYIKPKKGMAISTPASMKINGNNSVNWTPADDIAFSANGGGENNKIKGGSVSLNGSPIKNWTIDAGTNGLNKEQLEDILILVKYRI